MSEVTVIIISQGRTTYLSKCLESLKNLGEIPYHLIICSNGEIDPKVLNDQTRVLVKTNSSIGELKNLALKEAHGEWILVLNENSYLHRQYGENVKPILENSKIDVFGGPIVGAREESFFKRAMGVTLSSPLCSGVSFARYRSLGKRMMVADDEKLSGQHIWFRRRVLEGNAFEEKFVLSDEILLIKKLKKEGFGVFYHPKLVAWTYFDLKLKDFFTRGHVRSEIVSSKESSHGEVFWLPLFFVLGHLVLLIDQNLFLHLAQLYLGVVGFVSIGLSLRIGMVWLSPIILVFHYIFVMTYGLGFLTQRLNNLIKLKK
jgi:glycosyltransferase involved in cell wall biosynthesis